MSNQLQNLNFVQKFDLEALECNNALEQKWTQYKKEYEELKSCLEEFPKELSAPILMPLGSKVFVRAQLCNTNEVFIRYGEIFTKQTAYEAKAVCERHIKRCDEMLANLTKEKNWLNDRYCAKQEIVADSNELTELVEPYDPEKEAEWREIHRQKVKEYKQQLAKNKTVEKEKNSRDSVKKSDLSHTSNNEKKLPMNDLLARRDSVEELNSNGVGSDSDDCSTNDSYEDEDMDDDDDDGDDDDEEEEEADDIDDEDEDSKLEIVFTNDAPETTRNFMTKLKKKVSFNNDVQIKEFEPRPEEHFIRRREEISEETKSPEILVTEINDIVERVSDTCLENEIYDEKNTRPVSRFKAMRNKRNLVK